MAIANNYDLLLYYEKGWPIPAPKLYGGLYDAKEHAGQIVAMESLRHLKFMFGQDVVACIAMLPLTWNAEKPEIIKKAKLHPSARIDLLSTGERDSAHNLGRSFLQQGYTVVLAATADANRIVFGYAGPG